MSFTHCLERLQESRCIDPLLHQNRHKLKRISQKPAEGKPVDGIKADTFIVPVCSIVSGTADWNPHFNATLRVSSLRLLLSVSVLSAQLLTVSREPCGIFGSNTSHGNVEGRT